ncbi:hypothetical protein Leryth_015395 [Lithospermum erythrorhizon]|nr:hypothetical protein Leryth_015395 [Lithospermum erythrorhizon]
MMQSNFDLVLHHPVLWFNFVLVLASAVCRLFSCSNEALKIAYPHQHRSRSIGLPGIENYVSFFEWLHYTLCSVSKIDCLLYVLYV